MEKSYIVFMYLCISIVGTNNFKGLRYLQRCLVFLCVGSVMLSGSLFRELQVLVST